VRPQKPNGAAGEPHRDPRIDLGASSFQALVLGDEDERTALWRASFDPTRERPPVVDPHGMESLVQFEDGSSLRERSCVLPYLPELRIAWGLIVVEQRAPTDRGREVTATLLECLGESFPRARRPPMWNRAGKIDDLVDCVSAFGRDGYAFAIKREQVRVFYPKDYRAREYELLTGVADAIARLGLARVIHWTRDPVYVVNVWEPATA